MLLMTALQARQQPGAPAGNQVQFVAIRRIDKQTGKAVYRKEFMNNNNPDPFYSIEMNVRTGTIDLVNSTSWLRHTLDVPKGPANPKAAERAPVAFSRRLGAYNVAGAVPEERRCKRSVISTWRRAW